MNVKKQSFRNKFLPLVLVTVCALGATQEAATLPWMRVLTLGLYGGEASHAPQQASVAQPTASYATQVEMATLASRLGQLEQTRNRTNTITNAKDLLYVAALSAVCIGLYKGWRNFTDCPSREELNNVHRDLQQGQRENRNALSQARQVLQEGQHAIRVKVGAVEENLSNQQARGFEEARRERASIAAEIMADTGQQLNEVNREIKRNTKLLEAFKAIADGHREHLSSIQTDMSAARASIAEMLNHRQTDQQRLTVRFQKLDSSIATIVDRLTTHQTLLERIDQNIQGVRRLGEIAETGDQEPEPTLAPSSVVLGHMARNGSPSIIRDRRGNFSPRSMVGQHPSRLTAFRGGIWENRGAWAGSGFTPALGRGLRLASIANGFMRG